LLQIHSESYLTFPLHVTQLIGEVVERRARGDKPQYRTIFDNIMEDEELPAHELTVARLTDEATVLVIAASETPAKVLALLTFHLLRRPDQVRKIREELSGVSMAVPQRPSLHQLEQLPYLSAFIKEGLRLHSGIVARSSRVCARETLRIGNFDVPPGTPLSTSSYFIHRNPYLFPEP
jgi:cytochrome P450